MSDNTDERSFSIGTTLLTAAAAFTGSIIGNGLRSYFMAKSEHDEKVRFGIPTPDDVELSITGVVSASVAATALAHIASSRRPLVGLLLAAGLSAIAGDAPDRMILDLLETEPEGFVPMAFEEEPDGV
jgi:hypothetical protein